ncbi:hypothetical protein AB1K54_06245 [Microbacterium sp. BWT-B31]|uniref:hypothetical protein n=1 Tax=Microbacterium sp. BWT-B31 TaxID=3232072 RepID=UPI003526CA97
MSTTSPSCSSHEPKIGRLGRLVWQSDERYPRDARGRFVPRPFRMILYTDNGPLLVEEPPTTHAEGASA